MRVEKIECREVAGGTIRLAGRVVYDDQRRAAEELWFDFPAEHAGALSSSGNPWLIALLPLAAATGEPLHLSAPVDPLLLRNSYELMAIWRAWYPEMRDAELDAKACEPEGRETAGRTASFFSGGVDSFFTAIRHASGGRGGRIDDLLTIHGFDIPLDREIEFARHREILGRAAGGLGKRLIVIRTNLKATRLREVPWGAIGHGCALASVGLCLESRYGTLLIPSTTSFSRLHPWGSHPLTDPLFSTSRMRVVHDGAAWDRFDKLEVVARSEIVRRSLHVCYRDKSDRNCGTCTKCLQTMIGLELAGALEACETFPRRDLDLDRVAQVHLVEGWEFMLFRRLRALALSRGRVDVARVVSRALRLSRARRPLVRAASWMAGRRIVWRWASRMNAFARSGPAPERSPGRGEDARVVAAKGSNR